MTLFKKNEELTNKLNEQTTNVENFNQNYLHLKELYSKLYSDYELVTEKNEKFVNDTQNFYTKMIGKYENLIKGELRAKLVEVFKKLKEKHDAE